MARVPLAIFPGDEAHELGPGKVRRARPRGPRPGAANRLAQRPSRRPRMRRSFTVTLTRADPVLDPSRVRLSSTLMR